MSFGSDLQGFQSHEALLGVQDYEINLLENVRKCMIHRAKCDREYVAALSSVVGSVTQKLGNNNYDTPTGQVWSIVMEETERLIELMQTSADRLAVNVLEAVTQIIAEKKLVRKLYAEKRNSMDIELDRLLDDVNKCKELYECRLAKLVQNRVKYETMSRKGRLGSKLDELKAKYLRSEAKVRGAHNNYLIALNDANLYQRQYSCVILPAMLDAQQHFQEDLVDLCKQVLEEFATVTNWASSQFQQIHENIHQATQSVVPSSEYSAFVTEYRTEPVKFTRHEFDEDVVTRHLPLSRLSSGLLVVDESTYETVRQNKISYLEQLARCRQRTTCKRKELSAAESALTEASNTSACNAVNLSNHVKHRQVSAVKMELLDLQCSEEKYSTLLNLITEPLNRMSSCRLPPAVSDLSDFAFQVDSENIPRPMSTAAAPANVHNTLSNLRSSITRRIPFRRSVRSSVMSSQLPPPDSATHDDDADDNDNRDHYVPVERDRQTNRQLSTSGLESNSTNAIAARYADHQVITRMPVVSVANCDDGESTDSFTASSHSAIELDSLTRSTAVSAQTEAARTRAETSRDSIDISLPVTTAPTKPSAAGLMTSMSTTRSVGGATATGIDTDYLAVTVDDQKLSDVSSQSLDDEPWYHGVLPRDEVHRLLLNDGDFLVRLSSNRRTGEDQYVLSVKCGISQPKHFIIQHTPEGGWRLERLTYASIPQMVTSLQRAVEPVTRKSGAILKTPISRPDWMLSNDDVELQLKIGSGQFGEVFRGRVKSSGLTVAVKTCREDLTDDMKLTFLNEGHTLQQYNHPNIVKLIGIAALRHPVMIVMEFIPGGSLLSFLRKHGSHQTVKTLVKICEDAAAGMMYLASMNCIHRDLAARNCLIGDNLVVKISDFGMSRQEREYVIGKGQRQLPIKWTAPEALMSGTYTTACDVWSFGILMWEVFSFGSTPYPGLTNAQASDKVVAGYRMPPPTDMPESVYNIAMRCWELEPQHRPTFKDIYHQLRQLRDIVR